jgi:hypothetical protein
MSADFDAFWVAYPKRQGLNPKHPARTKFDRAVANGAAAQDIIKGAKAYASDPSTKIGTEFVAMAATWLNQRRWEDYAAQAATPVAPKLGNPTHAHPWGSVIWLMADTAEWTAWRLSTGKSYPLDRYGGWSFPARWPPGFEAAPQPNSPGNSIPGGCTSEPQL